MSRPINPQASRLHRQRRTNRPQCSRNWTAPSGRKRTRNSSCSVAPANRRRLPRAAKLTTTMMTTMFARVAVARPRIVAARRDAATMRVVRKREARKDALRQVVDAAMCGRRRVRDEADIGRERKPAVAAMADHPADRAEARQWQAHSLARRAAAPVRTRLASSSSGWSENSTRCCVS